MSTYGAQVSWSRGTDNFADQRYSRRHVWRFDGGQVVAASSSPHSVPLPMSDAAGVDPEEAFVASLASCHMLWFLAIAARHGWIVDAYEDAALGELAKDERGRLAMTKVTLRPRVQFAGERSPSLVELEALHEQAHEACFIANSVRSAVRIDVALAAAR